MERLTMWYDGNHAICENEECTSGDCPFADPICEQVQNIIDRLAAYEATALEPEDIISAVDMAKIACALHELNAYKELGSIDRLRELAQADREGRCVVMPCKIGDPVWRLYDDCDFPGDCYTKQKCRGCEYRNLFIEEQAFCLSMLCQNGKLDPSYYTIRAEAEAALRREQE